MYEHLQPPCIVYNKLVNQIYNYNAVFSHKPIHIAGAIFDSCPGEFSDFSSSKCLRKSPVFALESFIIELLMALLTSMSKARKLFAQNIVHLFYLNSYFHVSIVS